LSNNVIKLDKYRKPKVYASDIEGEFPELEEPVMIGCAYDDDGNKSLHIVSTVDTEECLWMIDLAQKIVDSRSSSNVNDNE
jgi:hypothetical protein